MTKLGKILVLLQATLSLFALAGAAAVLTQHLNWFEVKAASGQPIVGVTEPLRKELATLSQAHERVASRWRTAAVEVHALEQQLPARRDYFAQLVELAVHSACRPQHTCISDFCSRKPRLIKIAVCRVLVGGASHVQSPATSRTLCACSKRWATSLP